MLGDSVQLPLQLLPGDMVKRIIWSFRANASKKIELVEYNPETSEYPKYNRQQLKLINGTTLQISALELNDSGVYDAQVTYQSTLMEECSFNLTVYGELKGSWGAGTPSPSLGFPACREK